MKLTVQATGRGRIVIQTDYDLDVKALDKLAERTVRLFDVLAPPKPAFGLQPNPEK